MIYCKLQVLRLPIIQPKDKFGAAGAGSDKALGIQQVYHLIEELQIAKNIHSQPTEAS